MSSLCSLAHQEIFPDRGNIVRHAGQAMGAVVVAEFEISQPDVEDAIEQLAGLGRTVRVGFPDQLRWIGQRRREFERGGQMDGRLAARAP